MSRRAVTKRPLCQVLEAGLARDELVRATKSAVLYNVVDSRGDYFGLCVLAPSGLHVYVEPGAMLGLEVMRPMRVHRTANTMRLANVLGGALLTELGK